MITTPSLRRFAFAALLAAASGAFAQAQPAAKPYEPQVGQEGKDVVWVPTPQALVDRMLDLAKVTSQDYVMDLGSGDGRTVITAVKRGARATGIEYNPDMVELSKRNAEKEGVGAKAEFRKADLFETDFSQASVITMFLLPDINLRLRPKILDMKPGTRVVSNTFTMGEWEADETGTVAESSGYYRTALLWIVPAKVEGTWKSVQGDLDLKQAFQKLAGTVKTPTGAVALNGKLKGDQISFTAGGAEYSGRVNGNTIEGTLKASGRTSPWKATRG
ncbi:MAG: class I SAM-dependent methyltransferase [Burkholderiales bacterium]|nr:class I SAM-dependent methyltransferase [Burkholderiales bacterium]